MQAGKNTMRKSGNQRIKEFLLRISEKIDSLCSVRGEIVPPKYLYSQYGGGSYCEIGLNFFKQLLDLCGLKREMSILDVGCGIGRMALPLTAYLDANGRYEGFDIMPEGIQYCSAVIHKRFPNFHFQLADIRNSYYNPAGAASADEYRFPFADETFDVVFSTSVFTHLPPDSVSNYLRQTARVLKPGGTCLHMYFLLNEESLKLVREKKDPYGIAYEMGGFMTNDKNHVESAIALPETFVRKAHEESGIRITKILYGDWCGRTGGVSSHQDICIAVKP